MDRNRLKYMIPFIVAVVITGMVLFHITYTYRNAEETSEALLRNISYFIGITLDQALNRTGIDEGLFLDILRAQNWEEIAFISLYDRDGTILLHSNRNLIGKKSDDGEIRERIKSGKPVYYYRELGTGEKVYVLDMPLHIHSLGAGGMLLRIALHTYPATAPLRHARAHLITALTFVLFYWLLTVLFVKYLRKVDIMTQRELARQNLLRLGEMSAVLAHQIRSPLSAIKGFAQYLKEKASDEPSMKEGFEVIVSESEKLEVLSEDLLLYAKGQEVRPEMFSLWQLLDEVRDLFSDRRVSIRHNISLPENYMIYTDREKLRHALVNIVENALDASPEGEEVLIYVTEEGGSIRIGITDRGEGMDEETLEKSTEPFFTTRAKGTGLGLPVALDFVGAIGGRVDIISTRGEGTTVTITIPERTG